MHANHYLETQFPSRTVGGFIEETVNALLEFAKIDPICVKAFEKLRGKETCFGWEEPLLDFADKN